MSRFNLLRTNRGWVRLAWKSEFTGLALEVRLALSLVSQIPGCTVGTKWADIPLTAAMLPAVEELFDLCDVPPPDPTTGFDKLEIWQPKRAPYPHQWEIATQLVLQQGSLLCDQMGLGKQQPIDSLILTPHGYKPLGNIRVGDRVIGSAGTSTRVTGFFPQGRQPSYRVTFSDASCVEAGPEHLWDFDYLAGGRRWVRITLTTRQLFERGVITRSWSDGKQTNLDLSKTPLHLPMLEAPVSFEPACELPVPAYLLGQVISNGSCAHGSIALVSNTADWPEIKQLLQWDIGAVHVYGGATRIGLPKLLHLVRALGLNVRSGLKFIPDLYLRASRTDRISLLHGLMDGDGSISRTGNRLTYHTTSRKLAVGLQTLVEQLGGICSFSAYDRTFENKPTEYVCRIRLPREIAPFYISRKLERYKPGAHSHPTRTLQSVEYVRDVESACIAVDALDQLYATEHAILTHNSTSAIIAAQSVRLSRMRRRPGLIVAPLFTRDVWRRELLACGAIADDLHDFCAVLSRDFTDASFRRDDVSWYFVHYDVVFYWWSKIAGLGRQSPVVSIVDEAHWVKNGRSQRGRGTLVAAGASEFRLLLTGTPLDNRPVDLWHLLTMATGMHSWGSPLAFRQRYCGAVHNGHGWQDTVPTNVDELRARMQPYYFRRTAGEVGANLPELTRKTLPAELGAYRTEHDAVLNKTGIEVLVRAILQGAVQHVLPELTRLRQITSRAKLQASIEFVENVLAQGESIVVFAWEREIVAELKRRLGRGATLTITGDDSEAVRSATIASFQRGEEPRALIATMGAIREGVTLHHARFVMLHDLHWQMTHMLQAEARIYRIGQHRACQSIWVMAQASVDTILASVLQTKSETLTTILGDTAAAEAALDVDLGKIAGRETVEEQVANALRIWETSA